MTMIEVMEDDRNVSSECLVLSRQQLGYRYDILAYHYHLLDSPAEREGHGPNKLRPQFQLSHVEVNIQVPVLTGRWMKLINRVLRM
jgi:hypothetical protein